MTPAERTLAEHEAERALRRRHDARKVRRWARANGYPVSARGGLPIAVLEEYEAAMAPEARARRHSLALQEWTVRPFVRGAA